MTDTFKADSEQRIVDLLDYISNGADVIPDNLPQLIGQELYRMLATSSWNSPRSTRILIRLWDAWGETRPYLKKAVRDAEQDQKTNQKRRRVRAEENAQDFLDRESQSCRWPGNRRAQA